MTVLGGPAAVRPATLTISITSFLFTLLGLVAFNLGYIWLYWAFLPLLLLSALLSVEIDIDFFLSLLLLAVASTALYSIGIFSLPLVSCGIAVCLPAVFFLEKQGVLRTGNDRSVLNIIELHSLLLIALFARYLLYRAVGGTLPLNIGEFESFTRFLISEVGGWAIFALGYGTQQRVRYSASYLAEAEFASSWPSLLAAGLFLVSPHVAIMTLGLNIFGVTGLYVGSLPVGAAHLLLRALTSRRLAIERQNRRMQQMNMELARSEKLAAVGEMSSAISHQLLQKVGLVGLQSSLLRDVLLDDSSPVTARVNEGRERVEQLDESIADLNTTLSDLLIFSKDVSLHLDSCQLHLLLQEVEEEVCGFARSHEIVVLVRSNANPLFVTIDRIKIKQALLNLLTNAIEASLPNGQVDLALLEEEERVQIHISDAGVGIPENILEKIFSPFFSTKARGTGLGLTFAQKIVTLHGGEIRVKNNLNNGATFVIFLPKDTLVHG